MHDLDTRALESGMHPVKVFYGEADARPRFLISLQRGDGEQEEVSPARGPRSPGGVHVACAGGLVELGIAKRQSEEVAVEPEGPIKVAHSQLYLDQSDAHCHLPGSESFLDYSLRLLTGYGP